ncbi:MAG: extracellular solute-binding protein [Anaerolineaceae bacterium]|nr:extracellular solute-binding protein [Anaerolineaceae bacterium]
MQFIIKKALLAAMITMIGLSACGTAVTPVPSNLPTPTVPVIEPTLISQPTEIPKSGPASIGVMHYFSDSAAQQIISNLLVNFNQANPQYQAVDKSPTHGDYRSQAQALLTGDNPPDLLSYWAGAPLQALVDSNHLLDLTSLWNNNKLDNLIPASIKPAVTYNGKIYAIPQDIHIVGFFYNPKVFAKAGITSVPKTWSDFLVDCNRLKATGAVPIALGSKSHTPDEYWFDYLLTYTAGADFRQKLLSGQVSYTDPQVIKVMQTWQGLITQGYFIKAANIYDLTDAADQVAQGQAGMTLLSSEVTSYWDSKGFKPGVDYDFFPFPILDNRIPPVVFGSVDTWVVSAHSKNPQGAQNLLLQTLDPKYQQLWLQTEGDLAAVKSVADSAYSSPQKKMISMLSQMPFYNIYELSTAAPIAKSGLNSFALFMGNNNLFQNYLNQTDIIAKQTYGK